MSISSALTRWPPVKQLLIDFWRSTHGVCRRETETYTGRIADEKAFKVWIFHPYLDFPPAQSPNDGSINLHTFHVNAQLETPQCTSSHCYKVCYAFHRQTDGHGKSRFEFCPQTWCLWSGSSLELAWVGEHETCHSAMTEAWMFCALKCDFQLVQFSGPKAIAETLCREAGGATSWQNLSAYVLNSYLLPSKFANSVLIQALFIGIYIMIHAPFGMAMHISPHPYGRSSFRVHSTWPFWCWCPFHVFPAKPTKKRFYPV